MKNIHKICWALLLSYGIISCKKPIDIEPTHTADGETIFKNISDYEASLTAHQSSQFSKQRPHIRKCQKIECHS